MTTALELAPQDLAAAGKGRPSLDDLGLRLVPTRVPRQALLVGRPLAFLAIYWSFAMVGWWPIALVSIAAMFISGVAVLNDLIHDVINVPERPARAFIGLIAALMLENGAAVRETHLQHHFGKPGDYDPEGYIDSYSWPRLLLECPRYRYRLWAWTFRARPEVRHTVVLQAVVHLMVIVAALALPSTELRVLVITLVVAGLVFPIISARGPQTAWGSGDPNATIVRGRVVPRLLLGMVYHLEHHLYPSVPTYQLAELARRLDPWLHERNVKCVRVV